MVEKKKSLRYKSNIDLAERVFAFKRTLRQWFYFAGLKYLQTHNLTDTQEATVEDFSDFVIKSMDTVEKDNNFLEKVELEPVKLPKDTTK